MENITVKSHSTILCGWNKERKLIYMRTFDYENSKEEKELAQLAIKWCSDKANCEGGWMIGDIETVNIVEREIFNGQPA